MNCRVTDKFEGQSEKEHERDRDHVILVIATIRKIDEIGIGKRAEMLLIGIVKEEGIGIDEEARIESADRKSKNQSDSERSLITACISRGLCNMLLNLNFRRSRTRSKSNSRDKERRRERRSDRERK